MAVVAALAPGGLPTLTVRLLGASQVINRMCADRFRSAVVGTTHGVIDMFQFVDRITSHKWYHVTTVPHIGGGRAERLAHLYCLIRNFDSDYYYICIRPNFGHLPQIEIDRFSPVNTSARPPLVAV